MASMATVRAQVDLDVERRASEVLRREGLTVEDAVRVMLTRTADEGALPFEREAGSGTFGEDSPEYDAWFRAKVQQALDDPRPHISHAEVMARSKKRIAELLSKQNS